MSLHIELKEQIEKQYAGRLSEPVRLAQDALLLAFDTGLVAEVRYANPEEYAIGWCWGEAEFRIDTAPLHPELATFPNHLHDCDGNLVADPLTTPGANPWHNVQKLLDALLEAPLLGLEVAA